MMKNMRSRGFTLIELLVVIAIIGILSAVVLASLNSARAKGADAAVKSDLSSIRAEAEIYYDNNNKYGASATSCTTAGTMFADDNQIKNALAQAKLTGQGGQVCTISSTGSDYLVATQIKSTTHYWCIDSTGVARDVATVSSGAITCPAS
ncbi:MAG TPA: type II secretion system protein [Candidatus Paceibacterota bacterium]|nr:type II secretion system protein [Candidatus Paceibacterota bacterium]